MPSERIIFSNQTFISFRRLHKVDCAMGRKKRKAEAGQDDSTINESSEVASLAADAAGSEKKVPVAPDRNGGGAAPTKSGYAVTSHSGEIIQEDIYVSDGSENSDDGDDIEIVLIGSRTGIMRRGLHHLSALQQPNRQWTRQPTASGPGADGINAEYAAVELTEEEKRKAEEEELARLDPAQRAARLLQEKQRKLEEAKEEARQVENEENATKDPTLFSKRTAFDIRFDQIDDKPWTRGSGDVSDFFNYGMAEEDWLEYAQQQLIVRQELIDATRQKRPPDPIIVPVQLRSANAFTEQQVDLDGSKTITDNSTSNVKGEDSETGFSALGPLIKNDGSETTTQLFHDDDEESDEEPYDAVEGGAWGAGAPPGSVLAKLIEEQQHSDQGRQVAESTHPQDLQPSIALKEQSEHDRGQNGDSLSEQDSIGRRGSRRPKSDYDSYVPPEEHNSMHYGKQYGSSRQEFPEDFRDDGANSVSSSGQRRRSSHHSSHDEHYGGSRGGWHEAPPPPMASSYYPPPPSVPPPPTHTSLPYSPPPQAEGRGYRGRGGGRGSFVGGRFPAGRGRGGGRSSWDSGRGSSSDYDRGNWKRPRDDGDPRGWRR